MLRYLPAAAGTAAALLPQVPVKAGGGLLVAVLCWTAASSLAREPAAARPERIAALAVGAAGAAAGAVFVVLGVGERAALDRTVAAVAALDAPDPEVIGGLAAENGAEVEVRRRAGDVLDIKVIVGSEERSVTVRG